MATEFDIEKWRQNGFEMPDMGGHETFSRREIDVEYTPPALTKFDVEILQLGKDLEFLVTNPTWKTVVLDFLEKRANEALIAHRDNLSSDPVLQQVSKMRWKERDEVWGRLQGHVQDLITHKKNIISDLINSGVSVTQLESALSALKPNIT